MLGQWRIVLRQAEEAARAGRLDEALALASRPDVAEFRQAIQLRGRFTTDLVDRALRRADAHDLEGAAADLELAEIHGAAPDALASARHKLADRLAEDVRIDFEAGETGRVAEMVTSWSRRKVASPTLRRFGEAADSWQRALADQRRGEFGNALEALDRAERLAGQLSQGALASVRRDLEARQKTAAPRIERLYESLREAQWPAILAAADAVLELLPEHPAARQARSQAWRQIGALAPAEGLFRRNGGPDVIPTGRYERRGPVPATAEAADFRIVAESGTGERPAKAAGPRGRFLLWADSIGGFLVCLDPEIVLGRAAQDGGADIPLLGDLSRDHARIVRSGEGYVIRARHATFVNGRKVEEAPLRHGDVIRLGSGVELEFRQPSPVSTTARLEILSRHRLPLAVDGIILMGETCILGASAQAHIAAEDLKRPLVLYRQGAELWCRAAGDFEVDGQVCAGRSPLTLKSSVLGDGFSFSLEPLPPTASGLA